MAAYNDNDSDDGFPRDFSFKKYNVKANIASQQSGDTQYDINLKTATNSDYKKKCLKCIGQIATWYGKYDTDQDGKRIQSLTSGTGTVFQTLPNNHFIVITCAHNLCTHSPLNDELTYAKGIHFFPNGMKQPENRMKCVDKLIYTEYAPSKSAQCPHDLAIVLFHDKKGVASDYTDIEVNDTIILREWNASVLCDCKACHYVEDAVFSLWGYPSRSQGLLQGENGGEATQHKDTGLWIYDISTYPGHSGAPLFKRIKRMHQKASDIFGIYGLHVWGDTEKQEDNCGILLDKEKLEWIRRECVKFEEIAKKYVAKPVEKVDKVDKLRKVKVSYDGEVEIWETDPSEFTLKNLILFTRDSYNLGEITFKYKDDDGDNVRIKDHSALIEGYAEYSCTNNNSKKLWKIYVTKGYKAPTKRKLIVDPKDDEKKEATQKTLYITNPLIINIGISKYEHLKDLSGPKKDVKIITDLFKNIYGYNMDLMVHNEDESEWGLQKQTLLNKITTARDNIATDIDSLIVILSGYGASGYLYASDYDPEKESEGKIGISDVQRLFMDTKFDAIPKIIMIDGCGGSKGNDIGDKDDLADNVKLWYVMYSNAHGYTSYGEEGGFLIKSASQILRDEQCRKETKNDSGDTLAQDKLEKIMKTSIKKQAWTLTNKKISRRDIVFYKKYIKKGDKVTVFFKKGAL